MVKLLFLEPANLICLAIIEMAAFLTLDGCLALCGLIAEGVYLVLARVLAPRAKWVRKLLQERSDTVKLNVALLVVCICGAMIIIFAGFLKHLLSNPLPGLTYSQTWEFCAVIWTILFLIYYFCKWTMTAKQKTVVVLLLFVLAFLFASLFVVYRHWAWPPYFSSEYIHLLLIAFGTLFMLLVDWVLWKKGGSDEEKIRSHQSFLIADIPVFVAFFVLLLCLFRDRDNEHPDAFLGGAVSFQLVLSNILFIVTEFNLLGVRPENHQGPGQALPDVSPSSPGGNLGTGLPVQESNFPTPGMSETSITPPQVAGLKSRE